MFVSVYVYKFLKSSLLSLHGPQGLNSASQSK